MYGMCGRYAIAPSRADAWASVGDLLGAGIQAMLEELKPRFNVAPTTQIPIVIQDPETREIIPVLARWGFIPHWWSEPKPPTNTINARSEEAARKPMWRHAWLHSRCLIAATHWYEWRQEPLPKQPFALQPTDGRGFMFAGLYSKLAPAEGCGESTYT
ncbi:MAG: SOS response-associated peptidase, partial [Nevskiales bacterium]